MESFHPIPKIGFYNGEVFVRYSPKLKQHITIDEIIWANDLKAMSDAAEKGVSNFLRMVDKKKKPDWEIRKYEKSSYDKIVHHVNGWWFAFKFGTGAFISRW